MRDERAGAIDAKFAHTVTALAATAAITLALTLPGTHFWNAWQREFVRAETEAILAADVVSELATRNPELWTFEGHRLQGLLVIGAKSGRRRVLDANGGVLAELAMDGSSDVARITASAPVFDGSRQVGTVEISHSLRAALIETGQVGAMALAVAVAAFIGLRLVPLRLLRQALQRAAHLATHDTLTGLPNRALFHDRLEQALAGSRRDDTTVVVLYFDLDEFKEVNDTLGHAAGDELLRSVAERITASLTETETLARLGGDEFGIVQVGTQEPEQAEALARRILAVMAEPITLREHTVQVGASIGVAMRGSTGSDDDAGNLLQEADIAMYRAKAEGRGTYRFFEAALHDRMRERKALESDLRAALTTGGFCLHYQPQFDLRDGRLVGAEALIRWRHPQRGQVSPGEFIPIAEESGLIVPIGDWVLRESCRQAAAWPEPLRIGVNVSPAQFRLGELVQRVEEALRETGLDPARLEIEVTEGILLTDTEETLMTLGRLRGLGVTLAMDDFGTGYSSLGYLLRFHFDKIKIDRSFVHRLGEGGEAGAIVSAVVAMCRALGIRSNAEGVETEEEARLLRAQGCEEVQGYLFGRPMAEPEFVALMRSRAEGRTVG